MDMRERHQHTSHEHLGIHEDLIGLQARLLIGNEALNPQHPIATVTPEMLGTFATRDYTPLNQASNYERTMHGENQDVQSWMTDMIATFTNAHEFFAYNPQGQRWHRLFEQTLNVSATNFNKTHAEHLYHRYFTNESAGEAKTKEFIGDILTAYIDPHTHILDHAQLTQDLPGIQWIAHIFGANTSETITQLVHAEAKNYDPAQQQRLLREANTQSRINALTEREQQLLKSLWIQKQHSQDRQRFEERRSSNETEHDDHDDPIYIAAHLLDYQTGRVTGETFDLSQTFPTLVSYIEEEIQNNNPFFEQNVPAIFLSDVAICMIDAIAQSANDRDQELAFTLRGVILKRRADGTLTTEDPSPEKDVLIAAYAVPAMDYTQTDRMLSHIIPQIERERALALSQATNLQTYFQNKTRSERGDVFGMSHIHQDSHGEAHRAKPSRRDYEQIESFLRQDPQTPHYWGVVTKHDGRMYANIIRSFTDDTGNIQHQENLTVIPETALRQPAPPAA